METKVEALEDNRVKVTVTVDAKEIDGRIKKTYKDFAYKYSFPGFRRGKAPRPVIDNALGAEAVRATVTDEVVNETYPLVVDESNLYPVAKPEFEDGGLVEPGKPYVFGFTLAVKPELELSSYEAVEVELPAEGATDAEVDEQVESLREHYYTFEDASAATKIKEGGFADLAIKAADDAGEAIESLATESRIYGLGSGLFPEAFDQELVGMKKGQTKSFVIDVPAESSTLLAQVAGKTAKVAFDVEVKAVKTKELPEVTDEWAKDTLGFENVEDLRARIAESIAQQKADVLPRMKENACLAVLSERLEGEVPQAMAEDSETSLLQDFFQQLQRQNMTLRHVPHAAGHHVRPVQGRREAAGPRHGQAGPGAGRLGAPLRAFWPPTPTWPPSSRRAAPKTPRRFRKNGARTASSICCARASCARTPCATSWTRPR